MQSKLEIQTAFSALSVLISSSDALPNFISETSVCQTLATNDPGPHSFSACTQSAGFVKFEGTGNICEINLHGAGGAAGTDSKRKGMKEKGRVKRNKTEKIEGERVREGRQVREMKREIKEK